MALQRAFRIAPTGRGGIVPPNPGDLDMTHHLWRSAAFFSLVAVTAATGPALARDQPFKIQGGGVATEGLPPPPPAPDSDPRMLTATGEATYLGRYQGEGTIQTFSLDGPTQGVFTGTFGSGSPFNFTAANDEDVLATRFGKTDIDSPETGYFTLTIVDFTSDGVPIVTGHFVAQFDVLPDLSRGRFTGVTGSWLMTVDSERFVLGSDMPTGFQWEGAGTLHFPRPGR
jgi:hypothetical protein